MKMENLTINQRISKIIELAGDDISVAINLNVDGTINIPEGKRGIIVGNTLTAYEKTAAVVDKEFDIPTDTNKYEITETEHGTSWKLKDESDEEDDKEN
jgi:hypothetical protein